MAPHRFSRLALALVVAGGVLSGPAGSARAHLSIIRQGPESRGTREHGDLFGKAVALGDFNGDGYDDLATGSPGEDLNGKASAGAVIVNVSNHLGVTHTGARLLTQADIAGTDKASASFGWSLAAGDFNHDGFDDLVVGAPYWDSGTTFDCGSLWYYRGSAAGLIAGSTWTQSAAGGSSETDDLFGYSLAVGDFNDDGFDDLAVGGPGEDNEAGAVFQFLGAASGFGTSGTWFKQTTLGSTSTAGDKFGWSLAAGNLISSLGAQYDELAVGTPGRSATAAACGAVWIMKSGSTGLRSTSPLMYTAQNFDSQEPNAWFGYAVAAGRYFGGTTAGLAVGEPMRTVGGQDNAGRVVVAKGGLTGLSFATGFALDQTVVGEIREAQDRFGLVVASGDLDVIDAEQELIVGTPEEDANGLTNPGFTSIFFGGTNGPTGQYGWYGLFQDTLGDSLAHHDKFGSAFASGVTDDSGRGTIVATAPGDYSDAGLVHVFAPWRQVTGLMCRTSAVWNCDGEFVFSQKPFEEVCIASTTKIMTVLIACERSQLPIGHIKRINLTSQYVVPSWIWNQVPGSRFGFAPSERINLEQLLYACIHPSGNDAAYAIADMCTGSDAVWSDDLQDVVPDFIDEMNARAAQLGMTRTLFTNPAGLDLDGTHHSTAEDMLKLCRAAMQNDLFREVVSTLEFEWTRRWLSGSEEKEADGGTFYGWLDRFQDSAPTANGVKPGGTPCAHSTRCFSVPISAFEAPILAATFGSDGGEEALGADLIELGMAACDNPLVLSYQWDGHYGHVSNARTLFGAQANRVLPLDGGPEAVVLDLFRQSGNGTTAARLEILRNQEVHLSPGQTSQFGFRGDLDEQGEIRIANHGPTVASLQITMPYGAPINLNLSPGDVHVIPPHAGGAGFAWSIRNASGGPTAGGLHAWVTVDENYAWDLPAIGTGAAPQFSTALLRQGHDSNLTMRVIGADPNAGSTLHVVAHHADAVSGVGDIPAPELPEAPPVTNLRAAPNPFAASTRIAFTLARPGDITLGIYDIQGREIVRIDRENAAAGHWSLEWDGRTTDGGVAAAGTYFYRVSVDERPAAEGRIVRVR